MELICLCVASLASAPALSHLAASSADDTTALDAVVILITMHLPTG